MYQKYDIEISRDCKDIISCIDHNSIENKSAVVNSSLEHIGQPVSLIDIDQKSDTINNECDRQPSLSLRNLEFFAKDPKCSVRLSLSDEELDLSLKTKHSVKGCDLDDVKIPAIKPFGPDLEKTHLNSFYNVNEEVANLKTVNSFESTKTALIMEGDSVEASNSCHTDGSNSDMNSTVIELNISKSEADIPPPSRPGNEYVNEKIAAGYEEAEMCSEPKNDSPTKSNSESEIITDTQICDEESNNKQGIFFSTPDVTKKWKDGLKSQSSRTPDFGLVSPLDMKCFKGKQNLKRKFTGLHPIEETEEDTDTSNTEKKIKISEEVDAVVNSAAPLEASTSTTLPCFEAPARSLLKKWQPSCLSRNNSSSTYIVLDECGETELEDCSKLSQEHDPSRIDDFEIACQSLTEELLKSSSNIETLEKYHSQVQLENQMDDEKFDEILKELTMNVDLDDKTCISLRSMDDSTMNEVDKTCYASKTMEESVDSIPLGTDENKVKWDYENETTITEHDNHIPIKTDPSIEEEKIHSIKTENVTEKQEVTDDNTAPETKPKVKTSSSDEEVLDLDEEDFLLEENINTKDKPYEFFEFVSTDPKENEDNYNPEWQKLGRLTSDEERYKAVRDRWRSLVPPDPNRNLTFRQWRARNNKSPIKLSPLNNNHQMMDDKQRNQLCTAVFDNKITKIVQELEDSRMNIYRQRNREFEELGRVQDEEQMRASMRGWREMALLHTHHLNQCRAVKSQYDQELKRIQDIMEGKIRILREASEEVLLFQKFYKGVGARDDNEMYMTDIQVQELMETEEMLEQYKVFYK